MSLKGNLKELEAYHAELKKSKNAFVEVGVIANKLTRRIYKKKKGSKKVPPSVTEVAAVHEFGTSRIPQRSFLRMPFELKQKEINVFVKKQYKLVFEGKSNVKVSLGLIGIFARNISLNAFETGGFGRWPELSPETVAEKGTSTILVETGTLKQSISWEVKGVTT